MFRTGLVSISFRQNTVEEIVAAVREAGLQEIEWGSDVHVLPGNEQRTAAVRELMEQNGLRTAAYGSYYELGKSTNPQADFAPYLQTAIWLGAPVIRIWAGNKDSAQLSEAEWDALANEARLLARMALEQGVKISLECHPYTLTDDYEASLRFLQLVDCEGLTMYWQPNQNCSFAYNLLAAKALAPDTTNLHVFSWDMVNGVLERYPLSRHQERWKEYLNIFASTGGSHALLLEFMHDDRLETLKETAATLLEWTNAE